MERRTHKKNLRQEILQKRNNLTKNQHFEMSSQISEHISNFIRDKGIEVIFSYAPTRKEPNISSLSHSKRPFALPAIRENFSMDFYLWKPEHPLEPNHFEILEPIDKHSHLVYPNEKTLIITPSLAISLQGERLGYGAGFYDRYFSKHPLGIKMGCCFSSEVQSHLQSEKHDIPLDYIATEKGIKEAMAQ